MSQPDENKTTEGQSLSKARSVALIVLAVIEALFFGFIMDGWPSIEYMLKSDGVYSSLCTETTNTTQDIQEYSYWRIPSRIPHQDQIVTCPKQDTTLNIAYLIANIVGQTSAGLLGYIFDRYGLRISRIFIAVSFLSGLLMLSFKNLAFSWLIFPATLLLSIPSFMIVITTSHVAVLAGSKQATCIALISGCLDVSALAATFMQMAYDAGITRAVCIYFYAGLFLIHVLNTIFLSPKYKVYEEEVERKETKDSAIQLEVTDRRTEKPQKESQRANTENLKPFWKYAISPLYIMHTLWFTITQLRFWYMLGSLNTWLNLVTDHDQDEVSKVTMIFGYLHFSLFIISPAVGIVTDYQVAKAMKEDVGEQRLLLDRKENSPEKNEIISTRTSSDSDVKRAYPVVFSLSVATLSAVALSVSSLFKTISAAYASSVFAIILKGVMYASSLTFVQTVYPPEYHGKAFGISAAVASILNLVEEPLFIWAEVSDPPFQAPLVTLLVLCALTMFYPAFILIKNKTRY